MGISITQIVCLAAFHAMVHGAFIIFFINTSYYANYKGVLNHLFTAAGGALALVGVLSLIMLTFRMPMMMKVVGILYMVTSVILLATGIAYTVHYFPFYANSMFDKLIFYTDIECWVGPDYAMTIWHVFALGLTILSLLWLFYGFMIFKLAQCVCCIPCPPPSCYKPPPCDPCCQKVKYKCPKKPKCGPPPCCPPPCPPPCPPCSPCPPPCPPPCSPCPKKAPKFVLTLRPGKMSCK